MLGIAYEEDDGSDDAFVSSPDVLPNDWPLNGPFPNIVARFLSTVGSLTRLHSYFPGQSFQSATRQLELLNEKSWFGGGLPDALNVGLLRAVVQKGEAEAKQEQEEVGFGYGELGVDVDLEASFGYGEDNQESFSYGEEEESDLFVIRFSRSNNAFAVVLLDSRRGIRKLLIRRTRQGLFTLKGSVFSTLDDVAAYWISQGFHSAPRLSWKENHELVLDHRFSSFLETGPIDLICQTAVERQMWTLGCFYGRATDPILATLMQKARNPKAFCLRYGSQPGSLTLCVSKPDKSGSNEAFPHYFKFSIAGKIESDKLSIKGWKEAGQAPPADVTLQQLVDWMQEQEYELFVAPGCWGRSIQRSELDPLGKGILKLQEVIGEWDRRGRDDVLKGKEILYGLESNLELDLVGQAVADPSSLRALALKTLRKHFSPSTVEFKEHGCMTLVVVGGKLDAGQITRAWLRAVEELLPQVFLQTPLMLSGSAVSWVDKTGACFDALPCIDGRILDGSDGFRPVPPPPALVNRKWLLVACVLSLQHARSDVLDLLRGGGVKSLAELANLLPWIGVENCTAALAAALVANQEYLAGLPTRATKVFETFRKTLGLPKKSHTSKSPIALIPAKMLQLERKIGGGNFGEVWSAKLGIGRSMIPVAVKKLLSKDPALEQEIIHEAALLDRIRHPAVVEFFGLSRDDQGRLLVVTELMSGSLLSWILEQPRDANMTRCHVAKDLCVGLGYCHLLQIIHRDVAARNVLIDRSEPMRVKLCDFGLAFCLPAAIGDGEDCEEKEKRFPIAVPWAAPEAMKYEFSAKTDIWSFAVTLIELYGEGKPLFDNWGPESPYSRDVPAFLKAIKIGKRQEKPFLMPPSLYEVVLRCWNYEPEMRCSLEDVLDVLDVLEAELSSARDDFADEYEYLGESGYVDPGESSYVDV